MFIIIVDVDTANTVIITAFTVCRTLLQIIHQLHSLYHDNIVPLSLTYS